MKILLGVSAGIAVYKVTDLASKLTQRGDEVRTLMTPQAQRFMTPVAFRAVTQQQVYTDIFDEDPSSRPEHISLSEWCDLVFIAPATADLIARLAAGMGDDIVTVTLLACQKPVVVVPAMNDRMWAHPAVIRNLKTLKDFGYRVIEPDAGHLACGSFGAGRLPEVDPMLSVIDEWR